MVDDGLTINLESLSCLRVYPILEMGRSIRNLYSRNHHILHLANEYYCTVTSVIHYCVALSPTVLPRRSVMMDIHRSSRRPAVNDYKDGQAITNV